jgi:hypothetical protein
MPFARKLIIALVLLLLQLNTVAQSPWDNYELLTTRQGLPHNTVQSLLQDREGFLWIGTYGGLCKYDGNKLTVFKNVFGAGDNTNCFYEALFEDKNGNIWVGSRGGNLSCYIKEKNIFKQYSYNGSISVKIHCFYQDSSNRIWIGNEAGELLCITGDTITIVNTGTGNILDMSVVEEGSLLLLGDMGLFSYDINTGTIRKLRGVRYSKVQTVAGLINSISKTVMILDGHGCYVVNLKENRIIRNISIDDKAFKLFQKIEQTRNAHFLYCDGRNIFEYNQYGDLKTQITISENEWNNRYEVVNSMVEDKSGIIWLGTNSGLFKIDRKKYQFKKIAAAPITSKITDNYIRALALDNKHNIWIGFRGNSVNKLSEDNKLTTYSLIQRNRHVSDKYITNVIFQLRNHNILFGGAQGLFINSNTADHIIPYLPDILPDTLAEIWSLYEDKRGNIWIGTRIKGLYIYNPIAKKLVQYKYIPGNATTTIDSSVWNITEDSKGDIWLGTDNGLYRAINPDDVNNLSFEKFGFGENPPIHVWNIVEHTDGRIFIGTIGEGLHEISADRKHIKKHKQFPVDIISSMIFDSTGNLWAGSVNGLYKYNVATGNYTYFSEDDGLISNDFNFKAVAKTPSGEFLFGGKMGIIRFFPGTVLPKDMHSVPVGITSLRIAGYDSSSAIYSRSVIQLTRRQNFLNIGFAVLDFAKPRRHRYRYMLKGFEQKWNYRDNTQPWATYTNLPPGHYSFVVQGSGDGIQWSDTEASLDFYIKPALWQRPVAQILAFIIILSVAGWAVYYKTRSVVRKEREQNKIEKQIAELELRALQAQMNPHFIFNALNSIQQFVIHNNELAANDYLTRFARLMRLFLESSKNRYVTLETEIEQLGLYLSLEKLRFEDKFDYTIELDQRINKGEIQIPSMLIQPFAENAINHGLVHKTSKGSLHIEFLLINTNVLKCIIDDDGVGRNEARKIESRKNKKHVSRGVQLIEERVKTYNFIEDIDIQIHITDKDLPQCGTKVEISIPIIPSVKI